jgi:hypothetical protein
MAQQMLTPMLALIVWTFVLWFWMYATRIPAMQAAGLDPGKLRQKSDLDVLPIRVRQVADNYNHLHEQPTIFYALVTYCVLAGAADATNLRLAWAYVGARVVHSLIQCTFNYVPLRFAVFAVASLLLLAMTVRCVMTALGGA